MFDSRKDSVNTGVVAGCTLNVLLGLLLFIAMFRQAGKGEAGKVLEFALGGIGITQWVALGPCIYRLRGNGEAEMAKGMAIAGGITMLLSGGCWALVLVH